MTEFVRLMKPYIEYDEVEAEFREVFNSGIFTRGRHVEKFRADLVALTGAKYAFLTTSATTALWVCLKMLNIGPGDEVVVSDFSFPATANVVEDLGATPVFGDVSLDTFNMTADTLKGLITPRTKAVIFVDALGNPTGLTDIHKVCQAHGIPLIEDAACAIGSSEFGKRCGSIADMTCFSFHPRKLICTGEGGAITTNNEKWADWFRIKLAHGADGMKGMGLDFVDYGYNFRLPELQAIMGSRQLIKIEDIIDERNKIRAQYIAMLKPLGFVEQAIGPDVRYNVQSLVFTVPEGCDRNTLIAKLKDKGIESTIGTYSLSGSSYYNNKYAVNNTNSCWLERYTITLPCYKGVDVEFVSEMIAKIL